MDFASECVQPMVKTFSSGAETGGEPNSLPKTAIKGPNKRRFETIFSVGKKLKGELSRVIAYPGSGLLGIAVSKKIGSKPRKNRVKRRFRDAIAGARDLLDCRLDYIVVVNAEAAGATFTSIDKDVRALLARVAERWESELECS